MKNNEFTSMLLRNYNIDARTLNGQTGSLKDEAVRNLKSIYSCYLLKKMTNSINNGEAKERECK